MKGAKLGQDLTVALALELLGKRVLFGAGMGDRRVDFGGDLAPSRIVGVVVPAPGSEVLPQVLMHDGDDKNAVGGYQYELYLDPGAIRVIQVLEG